MDSKYSIVEFLRDSNSSCGYCKSEDSHHNTGMWAYTMMVEDYQALIDRGWRRSGQYCYKPVQTITCCPLYTIRCEALNLKLSKSQKKLLKKVGKYLSEGVTAKKKHAGDADSDSGGEMEHTGCDMFNKNISQVMEQKSDQKLEGLMEVDVSANKDKVLNKSEEKSVTDLHQETQESQKPVQTAISEDQQTSHVSEERSQNVPKPGAGRDPSKPQCKKAKLLRLEKKQKKMLEKGLSVEPVSRKEQSSDKSLEDFIKEFSNENSVNKLEIRLLPSNSKEELIKESWHLFRKYQMVIHNETEDECNYSTFHSFLVATPLKVLTNVRGSSSPVQTSYGSFHQQYWLNGKLIAVGVIDILPSCVSSVYFFYDPDYSFLSLGTYGSLRELELVRSLQKKCPELCYYYMGYYVHTCPKMRYKSRYSPSTLLCPEVYSWHPIAECQRKLDRVKYSRFNDDLNAVCEDHIVSINEVLILYKHVAMSYAIYKLRVVGITESDDEEVKRYAELVGKKCAERMLLYR